VEVEYSCICDLKNFYPSARKKDRSFYQSPSVKLSLSAFRGRHRTIRPFSIIADPAFTEANKVLAH